MTPTPKISDGGASSADRGEVPSAVKIDRFKYWARRYWWIAALTIMLALGLLDVYSVFEKPKYVSSSRMMVSGRVSLPQGEVYTEGEELATFYGTQVALMESQEIIVQAIDLVTTIHPEVKVDEKAEVEANLELRTSIFDLKVTSKDPEYAKLLLDAIMDTYLSSKRGWKNQTTDDAVSAITEEIAHLDAEIRSDEQQLLDFQRENNVVFIEEQSSSAATYLVGLNNSLARLTKERDLLVLESKDPLVDSIDNATLAPQTARAGDVDSTTESALPGSDVNLESNAILAEQDRIEKLKILRDQFGIDLKDAHPKMIELADSIAKEEKFLELLKTRSKKTQDEHREDLELQIKNLQQQIVTWNEKSLDLSQRLGTYQNLKSKITRDQGLYNQLASSIQNVHLNKSLDQEDVVIMEAASKPKPVEHNSYLRLGLAFLVGLALGLGIIYGLVRSDNRINSPLELEENIEIPVIGQMPLTRMDKKTKHVPLLAEDDQRHDFLEHHRDIRSAILFGPADVARPRTLMITSAAPGEGKSTLAANLAAVFAYGGARVLLIDADLRKGVLHQILESPVSPGLSDCLIGKIDWRDGVQSTKVPNLFLLPRGKVSRNAGDLLLGQTTYSLAQESAAEYDFVFWDTPPLFAAHDAANLCSKVDGVLFMARVRHSSIDLVRSALDELWQRDANIFGMVLNAVAPGQPGYHNKYRYRAYGAAIAEA